MKKYVYVLMLFALLTGCEKYNPESDGYIVNGKDIEMGDVIPTTTTTTTEPTKIDYDVSGTNNGYEYVDLALSVKWATMNVGATSPIDAGNYYAWGETIPQPYYYGWESYKWCNGSSESLTKYCNNGDFGYVDNKEILELSDDAARQNWGGTWRMPSKDEFDELIEKCVWTDTRQNNRHVFKVTSKINGKYILLPCAGHYNKNSLHDANYYGEYWSCTFAYYALSYNLFFYPPNADRKTIYTTTTTRCDGLSVRAVFE